MNRAARRRTPRLSWRAFLTRDGRRIERQLSLGEPPRCPCCGGLLEARPGSRLARHAPLDAVGYDLDCRDCRRFWCIIRHTARSLRLIRMRRLAAAVGAVEVEQPETEPEPMAATVVAA